MTENVMETGSAEQSSESGPKRERHRVTGETILAKVRELVHEGNVRRLIIRNDDGRVLLEMPLNVGVVGAVLAPMWAAIGAVAALVKDCSIEVEREPEP